MVPLLLIRMSSQAFVPPTTPDTILGHRAGPIVPNTQHRSGPILSAGGERSGPIVPGTGRRSS